MPAPEIVYLDEMPSAVPVLAEAFWNEWGRHDGLTQAEVTERVSASVQRDALPLALVAREGASAIGTVSLQRGAIAAGPAPGPWLGALWVAPEHRGRGLGAELVAAAEQAAAELGLEELYAATSTAAGLFRRSGWAELDQFAHAGEQLRLFHRRIPG